eukprot:2880691-Prymnesium_polylepis.1
MGDAQTAGKRESKTVVRLEIGEQKKDKEEFKVEEVRCAHAAGPRCARLLPTVPTFQDTLARQGKGTKLGDIPNV